MIPKLKEAMKRRFDLDNLPPSAPYKADPPVHIQELDDKAANEQAEEWQKGNFTNCEVDSERVITVLTRFVITKTMITKQVVFGAIEKLSNWIETTPQGNDEEAANLYFLQQILSVLNDKDNDKIDELNVLMIRLALLRMKDHKSQEPVFSFWEVQVLTLACLSQDEMNQLELDNEFLKQLISMPVYGTEESTKFIEHIGERLRRRM